MRAKTQEFWYHAQERAERMEWLSCQIDKRALIETAGCGQKRVIAGHIARLKARDFRLVLLGFAPVVKRASISEKNAIVGTEFDQVEILSERRMRDARFRIKLGPESAEGLMSGYEPIDTWWSVFSKSPGSDPGRYSPAAIYRAALRYADGYPDPKTGQATAISSAYQIKAVRALIVHPGVQQQQVVAAK